MLAWPGISWMIRRTTIVLLLMPAVGVLAAKVQTALPEERRRVGFFITGLVFGMTPVMLDVMLNAFVPAYRAFAAAHHQAVAIVLATGFPVIPIVTAYAVVVERVLETRLVVRMAIQYALARYAVLGFVTIPLVLLARHVYLYRREPIVDVVAQAPPSVWMAVIFAVCLGWARRPLRLAIDRRYFREQYDARVILATLTDRTRQVESLEQLAALVAAEIDRALHVQRVSPGDHPRCGIVARHSDADTGVPGGRHSGGEIDA